MKDLKHLYYFENGKCVRIEDKIVNEKWKKKWTDIEK